MPEQSGIAPLMFDHRVPLEFRPGASAIIRKNDAFAAAGAGVGAHEQLLIAPFPAAGIESVHDGASRKGPVAKFPRIDRNRKFPPMNQVRADRVTPMHVPPLPAVRIVLIIE